MPYHIDRNMLVTPITVTKERSIPFYTQVGAGIISYNFLKFRRYFDDFFFTCMLPNIKNISEFYARCYIETLTDRKTNIFIIL